MVNVEQVKQAMAKAPVPSISTPFHRDGSIDFNGLRNQVDFIIEAGTGMVLLTYGDSLYSVLSDEEIAEVTRAVVEQTRRRAMVVAATGVWWTGQCMRFARFARDIGADVLMSLPPNWADASAVHTLKEHYTVISGEMPVMIVTHLGSRPLPARVIRELVGETNGIVAIKDDVCGAYGRTMSCIVDGKWAVLSGGLKENHLDIMPFGADGYLSVYMRFKPAVALRYWSAVQTGDIRTAVDIIKQYEKPYFEQLVSEVGLDFDAVIHASMEIFGVAGRWRRAPYQNATDAQMEQIKHFFADHLLL